MITGLTTFPPSSHSPGLGGAQSRDGFDPGKNISGLLGLLCRARKEALQRFVVRHNPDFNSGFNGCLEDDNDHTLWESVMG